MIKVSINTNTLVTVNLTEYGARIYNEYISDPEYKKVDGERLSLHLHELMEIFGGDKIGNGKPIPFVNNEIKISKR